MSIFQKVAGNICGSPFGSPFGSDEGIPKADLLFYAKDGMTDSIGVSASRQVLLADYSGTARYVNNTGAIYTDPDGDAWGVGNDITGSGTKAAPYATITKVLTQTVSGDAIILTPSVFYSGVDFGATGFTLSGKTDVSILGADRLNYTVIDMSANGSSAGGASGSPVCHLSSGTKLRYLEFKRAGSGASDDYSTSYWHYALGSTGVIVAPISILLCRFTRNYRSIKLNQVNASIWSIDRCVFDENFDVILHCLNDTTSSVTATIIRSIFSGSYLPTTRTYSTNRGIYAETANALSNIKFHNNVFIGIGVPIHSTAIFSGTLEVKNNFFGGSDNYNINAGAATTLIESNNAWSGGDASTTSYFSFLINGKTPDASDLYAHVNRARYKGWYILRFDDRPSATTPAKDSYYRDTCDILSSSGLIGSYAFDTAGLTAEDIATAQYLISKGHEITCHSYSHLSVDNAIGSPNNAPFTITGPGNITITNSGVAPLDTVVITITEGATSIEITYPPIVNLAYDMTDNPRVCSVVAVGVIPGSVPGSFDLGSLKGLRDYIDSLTNWSASLYNADNNDYPELTLARNFITVNQTTPSSLPLAWNTTSLHWWEMRYSKLVLENILGISIKSFVYPNYKLDSLAKENLLLHGYTLGMGDVLQTSTNEWNASYAVMFNLKTNMLYSYRLMTDAEITKRFESAVEVISNGHRLFSFMCHVASDFSLAQWQVLVSTLALYSDRAICISGNDLGDLISTNPLWSTTDGGLTYRRTDWSEYSADCHLLSNSPCIGSGIDPFVNGDGDQYDADGYQVWDDGYGLPDGHWIDGVDIGAYAYGGASKFFPALRKIGDVWIWDSAPHILDITGVDNAVYNLDGTGKEFATEALAAAAMRSLANDTDIFAGDIETAMYSTDQSAIAAKINRALK